MPRRTCGMLDNAFINHKRNISKLTSLPSSQYVASSNLVGIECKWQRGGANRKRCVQQLAARDGSRPHQSPAPLSGHHAIFILSQSASEPGSQSSRNHPKGASHSSRLQLTFHNHGGLSRRLLPVRSVSVKLCSDGWNLIWGGLLRSPPTHSRANAPLKMHILAVHPVKLMHMHHTSGTKRNYIASDMEYPSSHIQFRFLQEEAGGILFFFSFFSQAAKKTEPSESVKQIQDLLKGTHLDAA